MQGAMKWWCDLIGVTDPSAVQIATGIAAGGTALLVAWMALAFVMMIVGIFSSARD
jgi:hypothetical protein